MTKQASGLRIGLLGGSFNPAHEGHLHLSRIALRRLGLDQIWWLVSPQNPLKSKTGMADYDRRIAAAQEIAAHPRIRVSDFERQADTQFTVDTLSALKRRHPNHKFVWLMGADNLAGFHRWKNWQKIACAMPFAVIDRPGNANAALSSKAARVLERYRLDEQDAPLLAGAHAPAWLFLNGPRNDQSATALRDAGIWP